MTAEDAERFWRFSLDFYARPGVREDCLRLQDEGGLNVNLVLWCCWRARQGEALGEEDVRAAAARLGEWSRTVTRPLRALRRKVKAELGDAMPGAVAHRLYERLKKAELEAERVEQTLLCQGEEKPLRTRTGRNLRHLVGDNLRAYMALAGVAGNSPLRTAVPDRLARRMSEAAGER